MTDHGTKARRLLALRTMLFAARHGLTSHQVAQQLGVNRVTAWRYLCEIEAERNGAHWRLRPSRADIAFAGAVMQWVEHGGKSPPPQ